MYSTDQVDYLVLAAQACTSTGDKGGWTPGYQPHVIRACSIVITTKETTTPPVLNFTTQATAGSNSGISAGDIAILNVLVADAVGTVIYKDAMEKTLTPGQRVVFNVGTAGSTLTGDVHIFCEPAPETPLNNTKMRLTA